MPREYTDEEVRPAVKDVIENMHKTTKISYRKAAKKHGISKSTIQKYVQLKLKKEKHAAPKTSIRKRVKKERNTNFKTDKRRKDVNQLASTSSLAVLGKTFLNDGKNDIGILDIPNELLVASENKSVDNETFPEKNDTEPLVIEMNVEASDELFQSLLRNNFIHSTNGSTTLSPSSEIVSQLKNDFEPLNIEMDVGVTGELFRSVRLKSVIEDSISVAETILLEADRGLNQFE